MAVLDPIQEKYAQLVDFFQWWIPQYLPLAGVYLVGQNAPTPEAPFVGFLPLSSIDYVGQDERRIVDGLEILRGQRRVTCDLFGFSDEKSRFDGEENAWDMLQALRFSLGFPEVVDKLSEITCRVIDEGTVVDISETKNTENQPRSNLQITLSTVIIQYINSGVIETINTQGSLSLTNGQKTVDVTATK